MLTQSAYLVVAADRQPGPPPIRAAGEKWRRADDDAVWQPVGVRHGLWMHDARFSAPRKTLCGVMCADWHVWTDLVLDGRNGGDCRRCAQLAHV